MSVLAQSGKNTYGDITVETLDISEYTHYTIRTFRITEVCCIQYWPSQGKYTYGDIRYIRNIRYIWVHILY